MHTIEYCDDGTLSLVGYPVHFMSKVKSVPCFGRNWSRLVWHLTECGELNVLCILMLTWDGS